MPKRKVYISKANLIKLYWLRELPTKELLLKLNIRSESTLHYWLKKYKIKSRPHGLNTSKSLKIHSQQILGKNNPMYGKPCTEEAKQKIRNSEYHKNCSGKNNNNWKGGIKKCNGYIYILSPNHPRKNKENYVKRAILVTEKHIGRLIKPGEEVHHKGTKYPINSIENKSDDRIKNLQLFATKGEHTSFHLKLRHKKS